MDQAWQRHGCDNRFPHSDRLATFYSDPVWLLNGMFIEQHDVSMGHRQAITASVAALAPCRVLDFGGGFGTLARLLATALPKAEVAICEPYPPRHGIESCKPFANIHFIPELTTQSVDVLVSTDVLEHVPEPLSLLAAMVDSVRPDGHLLIANCFFPVIACHLPCTFHLRYSFDAFCQALGLEVLGPCVGSHATMYQRAQVVEPDWPRLRAMERRSQRLFPWREWRARHISPWRQRAQLAVTHPLHYPRKLLSAVAANR
ncbi:class I SAM-dependent methyltransferase [Cyanobium sp. Maggiore-St4-Cus]|uniref:class I SAM-dependent methyltransferase n=1 Tax=Cyanobium sp. Maggiore-St4-Cus TaxID=2823717 RepID=UPI0020CDA34A|nr:methyltransferase domain-containing protein [Cyanobium sp. Maggiore-St4-Cus]